MKEIFISKNKSIKDALKLLSKSGQKCLVVVLKNSKLLGTLSDGDIRKSILKGININSSINQIYNKNPSFFYENEYNENKVRDLLISQRLEIIPIVNENKKIVKMIYFSDIFKNKKNNLFKYS